MSHKAESTRSRFNWAKLRKFATTLWLSAICSGMWTLSAHAQDGSGLVNLSFSGADSGYLEDATYRRNSFRSSRYRRAYGSGFRRYSRPFYSNRRFSNRGYSSRRYSRSSRFNRFDRYDRRYRGYNDRRHYSRRGYRSY